MRIHHKFVSSIVVAVAALAVYLLLPADCPEAARRTAAVFVLAAGFWATEAIPLFATSIVTVLLLVLCLARPGGILGMERDGYQIFLLPLSNPVILLFLGGFALARVLQKEGVDRLLVGRLVHVFGRRPYPVLLGLTLVTGFLSFWISNTAAAALMLAVIAPILARLDSDDRYKKGLVLAIAFAAGIGGIGTPVGTPPNAIAIGILAERGIHISFLSWFRMAAPLAAVLLMVSSALLYRMFGPKDRGLVIDLGKSEPMRPRSAQALTIACGVVGLWLTSGWHGFPESVVSLLAVGAFAVLGFLDADDIKRLHWDILILMWGGLALGIAMETSGLGTWLVSLPIFAHHGFGLIAVFCITTVLLSMVISNTATANLILPIAMSIPGENLGVLAVVIALASSFDMVLPISTPPNALAFSTRVIAVRDMLVPGLILIVIAVTIILAGHGLFIQAGLGL